MNDLGSCLVIGGSGMLGFEIVRQLRAEGLPVRVLDLNPLPDAAPGVDARQGDLRRPGDVYAACAGVDTVFLVAAAVWDVKTPRQVYEDVNVQGTANVLDSCRRHGVRRLVFTSSMDVVVNGRAAIVDGDESLPYPARMPRDHYSRTKILAEKMVLAASGPHLATCAMRPAGMYGPRDKYHLGNIIGMARRGVSMRLGDGSAHFSHVYSENAAHAHVLAAGHLDPGSVAAGQAYFICDHFPAENLFDFMEKFLAGVGLPIPRRTIPYPLAYWLAAIAEIVAPRSNFNRFSVIQTCVDHTFVHHRAERDLGYRPIVSREEAFRRSLEWLKEGDPLPPA